MQHTCMVQWHVDGRPLVSAETECRSQPTFEAWDLLRSHSFFLHSYILFQSRESGQTLALTFCRGEWFKDVRSIHDQLQQPHRTDKIALVVLQGRSVVENKWIVFQLCLSTPKSVAWEHFRQYLPRLRCECCNRRYRHTIRILNPVKIDVEAEAVSGRAGRRVLQSGE